MKIKFQENNKQLELIFKNKYLIKLKFIINNKIYYIENLGLISKNKYKELVSLTENFNNKKEIYDSIAFYIFNTGYGFNEEIYNLYENKKINSKKFLKKIYNSIF